MHDNDRERIRINFKLIRHYCMFCKPQRRADLEIFCLSGKNVTRKLQSLKKTFYSSGQLLCNFAKLRKYFIVQRNTFVSYKHLTYFDDFVGATQNHLRKIVLK